MAAATDGVSGYNGYKACILEEHFARLEVRASSATSTDGSHTLPDGLSANFERIINEQRDHELFVFRPKVPSENCTEIL